MGWREDFDRGWARGAGRLGIPSPFAVAEGVAGDVLARAKVSPFLEDDVVVEVVGQPGATKQQLYYLAMATANGMVRRFGDLLGFSVPYGRIAIEYDAADHWVRAYISYKWAMMASVAGGDVGAPRINTLTDRMAVYRGPQCNVNGGDFDFKLRGDGDRAPIVALPTGLPNLPFQGQPILTSCPTTPTPLPGAIDTAPPPDAPLGTVGGSIQSPNPKPPGDNRSRGSTISPTTGPGAVTNPTPFNSVPGPSVKGVGTKCCDKLRSLVPLVYAALTAASTDSKMTYPNPTDGPLGG